MAAAGRHVSRCVLCAQPSLQRRHHVRVEQLVQISHQPLTSRRRRKILGALGSLAILRRFACTLLSPPFAPVKLWIDADASPRDVKDIVFRAADRLRIETSLVANHRVPVPAGHAFVTTVRVDGGPDVADRYIAEAALPGDVAVTADIPLAAILVAKQVMVLDPRGQEYTSENVGERLAVRDFMEGLRGAGVETGGPKAWGPREKQAFAATLDRVLTRALRRRRDR